MEREGERDNEDSYCHAQYDGKYIETKSNVTQTFSFGIITTDVGMTTLNIIIIILIILIIQVTLYWLKYMHIPSVKFLHGSCMAHHYLIQFHA